MLNQNLWTESEQTQHQQCSAPAFQHGSIPAHKHPLNADFRRCNGGSGKVRSSLDLSGDIFPRGPLAARQPYKEGWM